MTEPRCGGTGKISVTDPYPYPDDAPKAIDCPGCPDCKPTASPCPECESQCPKCGYYCTCGNKEGHFVDGKCPVATPEGWTHTGELVDGEIRPVKPAASPAPTDAGAVDVEAWTNQILKDLPHLLRVDVKKEIDAAFRQLARELEEWKGERNQLLEMTRQLDEHPEGYDGPCECKLCLSYCDCEGLDYDKT